MTAFGSGFLALLSPCPSDACDHSQATHDPAVGDGAPTCRAPGCRCEPQDLADEEWS